MMRRHAPTFVTLLGGLKLHYRIQGTPGAPWMVMLNGLLSDTTMWAGVIPWLSDHFRILSLDGRGQGKSDVPSGDLYTPGLLAKDVWEVFNLLGVERPWLVGLSNGSNVALELLAAHPGAFAGGVLISSVPHIDFTIGLRIQHWIHCLDTGGLLMQFDAVAPYLWGDAFLQKRYAVLRAFNQVVMGQKPREDSEDPHLGLRHQVLGILGWDIRTRLDAVQVPLLLLAGAEDLLTPPWKCLETAKLIPSARFEVIPGVGHSYPVETPKACADRILEFVTQIARN